MKNLALSDTETIALIDLLKRSIVVDRYPLSPRVRTLVGILGEAEAGTSSRDAVAAEGLCAAFARAVSEARLAGKHLSEDF